MAVKIVKIILTIIFGLMIGVFIFSNVKLNEVKTKNSNLNTKIIETNVDKINEENTEYTKQLDALKESKKAETEELAIWQKMLEKLQKASM